MFLIDTHKPWKHFKILSYCSFRALVEPLNFKFQLFQTVYNLSENGDGSVERVQFTNIFHSKSTSWQLFYPNSIQAEKELDHLSQSLSVYNLKIN